MVSMENEKALKDEIVEAIDERLDARFEVFEKKIERKFQAIDERFNTLETKMDDGFRHQGVLIEKMQDDIDTLVDGQEMLHERIDRVLGARV